MKVGFAILKYIGKLGLRGVLNMAGGGVLGDFVIDEVEEVWGECRREGELQDLREEIQRIAQANFQEFRQEVAQIVQEIAADQGTQIQQQLQSYLLQVQAMIRRTQRRPSDPTGTSLQKNLVLKQAQDLIPYLPTRLARFQPGDFPLSGVDWQLDELLGFGGFGEVWKARHPDISMFAPVALKFCLDTVAKDTLKREADILSRVMKEGKHPGIVQLQRTYLRADTPCLEYEFVEGGDLTGLIHERYREQGGIHPDQAAILMAQIAEIVGFAHTLHPPIVHRDLKPANILVQPDRDRQLQLKITDFGLGGISAQQAVLSAGKGFSQGQIFSSSLLGSHTPLYASPQQMAGGKPDPRDDVYSLGVIWYQLLTGNLTEGAPTGDGWKEDLSRRGMRSDQITWLSQCIEGSVERRFPNAQELFERMASDQELGSKKTSILTDSPKDTRTPEEYAEEMRNSKEAWSFVERHQGKPRKEDIQEYLNELTDVGIVGGGKLTRGQAEKTIQKVCATWIEADERRRERETWDKVKKADNPHFPVETQTAYENYLKAFPHGVHQEEAKKRVQEITTLLQEEDRLWQRTVDENTTAAYQEYLQKYVVGGRYLREAQQRKSKLEEEEAKKRLEEELWREAESKNTIAVYQRYINTAPYKHRKADAEKKIWEITNAQWLEEWESIKAKPDIEKTEDFIKRCNDKNLLEEISKFIQEKFKERSFLDYLGLGNFKRWQALYSLIKIKAILPAILSDLKTNMVLIPAGRFFMGSPDNEKDRSGFEGPQLLVSITKSFYLGKYLVTQAQWVAVMGSNPSRFKGDNLPVESVSWFDCQEFIRKLNGLGQGTFRLPTEAEWEYACRAGTTTRFYWGDDSDDTLIKDYAWYDTNAGGRTHEVGLKKPNAWGLFDMSGNVWEWCWDKYGSYSSNTQKYPSGANSGSYRVFRGGGWGGLAVHCRSATRDKYNPGGRLYFIGFRLAASRTQ